MSNKIKHLEELEKLTTNEQVLKRIKFKLRQLKKIQVVKYN